RLEGGPTQSPKLHPPLIRSRLSANAPPADKHFSHTTSPPFAALQKNRITLRAQSCKMTLT
ncbi:MAG: hypothetical protein AAFV25_17945, partial [Bacteroidota bacterium]